MKSFREALFESVGYNDISKVCGKIIKWVDKNDPYFVRYVGFGREEGYDVKYKKTRQGKNTILHFYYDIVFDDGEIIKADLATITVITKGIFYEIKADIDVDTRVENLKRHARFSKELFNFCGDLMDEQQVEFDYDVDGSGDECPHINKFEFKLLD